MKRETQDDYGYDISKKKREREREIQKFDISRDEVSIRDTLDCH